VTEEALSDIIVVLPALRLARGLSHYANTIDIINVKTIAELLPVQEQGRTISIRRADYTIWLEVERLDSLRTRKIFRKAPNHTLSQSDHRIILDQVICSNLEIKRDIAVPNEACLQLAIWKAAGLRKQEGLWLWKHDTEAVPELVLAPIPLWAWKRTTYNCRLQS